jgi:DNA ligase (NAD+)
MRILFTGTFSKPRREIENMAKDADYVLASGITNKLDYLVVGEKPGGKLEKARELSIPVLDEAGFLALVDGQSAKP